METLIRGGLQLKIENGLHSGALIPFPFTGEGVVGSEFTSSILIADLDFPEQAVALKYDGASQLVVLKALVGGVKVFNYKLQVGTEIKLLLGGSFNIHKIQFSIVNLFDDTCPPNSIGFSAKDQKNARRFFLRQFSRREYLVAGLRELWLGNYVYVVGLLFAGIIFLLVKNLLVQEVSLEARQLYVEQLASDFKNVEIVANVNTGGSHYTGYVDSHGQLNELRALAIQLDSGSSVIDVMPMDIMAFNTQAFLERYYSGAHVSIAGPGELFVEIIGAGSMNMLNAWDFSAVEEHAKREIPGLKRLEIILAGSSSKFIKTPLAGTGLSIVNSADNASFVIDRSHQIFFEGAVLKQGRILKILPCTVHIQVPGEAAVFEMTAQKEGVGSGCN